MTETTSLNSYSSCPRNQWEHPGICQCNANESLNPSTDEEDATDADEMTTFDGSTISLSLSPIMTPAREGDAPFNSRQENLEFVCETHVASQLPPFFSLPPPADRLDPQREGPLLGAGWGSERGGLQAEREHRRDGGDLHHHQGEDGGGSHPGEPEQVPQEEEEEVPHAVVPEKEQEKEGRERKNGSLKAFLSFFFNRLL